MWDPRFGRKAVGHSFSDLPGHLCKKGTLGLRSWNLGTPAFVGDLMGVAAVCEPLLQMDFADLDQWRLLVLGAPACPRSPSPSFLPLPLLGPFPLLRRLMLHPDRKSERANEGTRRRRAGEEARREAFLMLQDSLAKGRRSQSAWDKGRPCF